MYMWKESHSYSQHEGHKTTVFLCLNLTSSGFFSVLTHQYTPDKNFVVMPVKNKHYPNTGRAHCEFIENPSTPKLMQIKHKRVLRACSRCSVQW